MKTITVEQFMKFGPCYSAERVREIAGDKSDWSALDILRLTNVPAADRLWAVLREELIDAPVLHEFACRCAEQALALVDDTDPRSTAAIAAKRAWLRGEITDDQLAAASAAADAAAWATDAAAWAAARDAASAAAWAAASAAARDAASAAAWAAAWAADAAAWATDAAAWAAARDAAWGAQVEILRGMLEEGEQP